MKHFTLIIGFILFSSLADSKQVIDELALIDSFKPENLINQQQYSQYKDRIQLKTLSKSQKGPGGTAIINGMIQNGASPLDAHYVRLYRLIGEDQAYIEDTITDVGGNYTFGNLEAGNYLVYAGNSDDDYLDYMWNSVSNILCSFQRCDVPVTSHIVLADSTIVNNIDFSVVLGGKITGTVTDASSSDIVETLYF